MRTFPLVRPLFRIITGSIAGAERALVAGDFFHPAFTVTRTGTATRRNSQGLIEAVPANLPRFNHDANGDYLGLLVESLATNRALNSDAPANQTIDLTSPGTGDYTLSVVGSGSCAVAANTATGTGFGTATEGSPVTFNISAVGTIDLTVTGSLDYFQVEKGSFATSMIITAGSAVTRNPDVIACTDLDAIGFNPNEGTVYIEGRTAPGDGTNRYSFTFNDGTGNESFRHFQLATDDSVRWQVVDGGVQQAFLTGGILGASTDFKTAFAYAANDFAASRDGATVVTDTSGTLPTPDRAHIGGLAGSASWNGHIRELRYYPSRLSNSQLESLAS